MSDLTNKVISSNFQRLLQVSESGAIADGTGSAFGLKMSGSNIAINTSPADGIDLAVAGTISASIISASTGVFGADTVFIGGVQMSENSDGGVTFTDASSRELGAFQGDGFFILSSSLESGGSARPLFSLTQQVGSSQNVNVMQVDQSRMKFYIRNTSGGTWTFGANPSGSLGEGDFFINPNFTANPRPGNNSQTPSLYITQSTKNMSLGGIYPNDVNKLSIGGSVFISGSNSHITASGNISASGTVFASAFSSPHGDGDIDFLDSLDVVGNITSSGIISASGGISSSAIFVDESIKHIGDTDTKIIFGVDSISFRAGFTELLSLTESSPDTISFGAAISSNITASGNISSSGTITAKDFTSLFSTGIIESSTGISSSGDLTVGGALLVSQDIQHVGDDNTKIILGNPNDTITIQAGGLQFLKFEELGSDVGFATINPSSETVILRHLDTSGNNFILANPLTKQFEMGGNLIVSSSEFIGNITSSGNITASGNISANGTGSFGKLTVNDDIDLTNDIRLANTKQIQFENAANNGLAHIRNSADDIFSFRLSTANKKFDFENSSGTTIATLGGSSTKLDVTGNIQASGFIKGNHITASGNISSSGTITANTVTFSNLPTSEAFVSTGELFTQSGSQLPFETGSFGSSQRALFNQYSSSKFVLIK